MRLDMTRFLRLPAALCCLLLLLPAARAQTDPVEDLKEALQVGSGAGALSRSALDFRQQSLEAAAMRLRTINELREALKLIGWQDAEVSAAPQLAQIDRTVRGKIASRLVHAVQVGGRQPATASRLSTATFIGEMGVSVRATDLRERRGLASTLTPELARLTRDPDPQVRTAAALALGKINPVLNEAVPALQRVLERDGVSQKRAAAEALGTMVKVIAELASTGGTQRGARATEEDFVATLAAVVPAAAVGANDADPHVRRLSMEALEETAKQLEKLIPEPGPESTFPRYLFTKAKLKLTPEELRRIQLAARVLKEKQDLLRPLLDVLGKQGQLLRRRLEDPEAGIRILSRKTLEYTASSRLRLRRLEESVPLVEPAGPQAQAGQLPIEAVASDPTVPAQLVPVAQKAPAPKTDDPLLAAVVPSLDVMARGLRDPSAQVRLASVEFLEMLDQRAMPALGALVGALCDPDSFVRWAAARTLSHLVPAQPEEVVPALAKMLRDQNVEGRQAATYTLKLYGPLARSAVPELARATQTGDAEPRVAAIQALAAILGRKAEGPEVATGVDALTTALRNEDVRVRQAAAEALGHIGPAAAPAIPALRVALNDPNNDVRRLASESLLTIELQTSGKGP
jgi:HEAT repeat protein